MSSKYWIRQVEIGAHAEAITALWSRCLRSLTPQAAQGRLRHRYLGNPAGAGTTLLLQAQDAPDEVAGVQCLHARTVHYLGRTWRVAGMADYAVGETHRTLGPALQLMKQMRAVGQAQYDWLYGLPNVKSEAVCKRSGLLHFGSVGRWTALLRTGTLLRRALPAALAVLLAPLANLGLLLRDALRLRGAGVLRWTDSSGFPELLDALWQRRPAELVISERSRALLQWRFAGGSWTVSTAARADGSPLGYVVWRLEDNVAMVADFLCADPARDTALLMRGFAWHMRGMPAERVTLEFFGAPAVAAGLKAAGFWRRPEDVPLYLAHGLREAPPADAWYFTGFDRDGD
jgi:hypothetical protein